MYNREIPNAQNSVKFGTNLLIANIYKFKKLKVILAIYITYLQIGAKFDTISCTKLCH